MRRPNRNIEIFSISALDLFASALGAFILIAIILFPYYLKDQKGVDRIAKAEKAAQAAEAARAALQVDFDKQAALNAALASQVEADKTRVAPLEAQVAKLASLLSKPFLVIGIRWSVPGADVDLHVTDPLGNEFYWFKNNDGRRDYPKSSAELSYDMTSGPAVELWQDASAVQGQYKVEYVANALPDGYRVEVRGSVFDRAGKRELPAKTLRRTGDRIVAATLVVGSDGSVTIR